MATGCERLAIMARFLRYTVNVNGCLIWTGGQSVGGGRDKRKRGGPYGSFHVSKTIGAVRAHVAWAWLTGKLPEPRVPEGIHLDHDCDHGTLCVTCTTPIPKSLNLSLASRKARKDAARIAAAREEAKRARLARIADRRERTT